MIWTYIRSSGDYHNSNVDSRQGRASIEPGDLDDLMRTLWTSSRF